jgi:very-short-patch-repair endonuclease
MGTRRLDFEEMKRKVIEFNSLYDLVGFETGKDGRTKLILTLVSTGETFICRPVKFFRGQAHAKSLSEEIRVEKRKKTMLEMYGVENPSFSQEMKEKRKKTNIRKYGCEHPSQNKEVQNKKKKTNLEKYGVEEHLSSKSIREKIVNTCIERYGVSTTLKHEDTLQKIDEINIEKYGTSRLFSSHKIRNRIENTNIEKYGVKSPIQNKEVFETIKKTNLERFGAQYPLQNPEIKAKMISTKIDRGTIALVEGETLKQIAKKKNVSYTTILNLKNSGGDITAYEKSNGTGIEQKVNSLLEDLGVDFQREVSFSDGRIRADFFIPKSNIVIECNGIYWHCEINKDKNYHFSRRNELNSLGIRVLQFNEIQIDLKFDTVKSIIVNALGRNNRKIYARNTDIREVHKKEYSEFIEKYHLMGLGRESVRYGLYLKDELLMVAGFTVKKEFTECSRLCSKENVSVVGGFSKLFKKAESSGREIRTFIDLNYGTGEYLEDLGFTPKKPYLSFKWLDLPGRKLHNRMKFKGDSGYNFGMVKFWDSGQQNWIKKI